MQSVDERINSKAMVEGTFDAISWIYTYVGLTAFPYRLSFCEATLQGLQKELAKPAHKMLPVTVERC